MCSNFWIFSANTHFQEIRPNVLQVRMVYKSEWSTSPSGPHVDHSDRGFWLFTSWKNLFWARLKWMIGALGELSPYMLWLGLNMRFKGRVRMVYGPSGRPFGTRFFDFWGGKDSIPRVMLIPPEPGNRSTTKIWNKKGGHFILRQSL